MHQESEKQCSFFFQKIGWVSFPVYPDEKKGNKPDDFPGKYPNALARLLVRQLRKLDRFNSERRQVALFYNKNTIAPGAVYLRFPYQVHNPKETIAKAKKNGILLGNWYGNCIDPIGVNYKAVGYEPGSCPHAEAAAKKIVNLPTRISLRDAKKVFLSL